MNQIRSFIAIELPDTLKGELAHLQAQLKAGRYPSVKWVDPDSIHLTLKFLGNIDTSKIEEITAAMAEVARGISPFHLEVNQLGAFPNSRRVQVIWVGINGQVDHLRQLQQRLESRLAPLGFPPESRQFKPHLTLARLRQWASAEERSALGQLIANTSLTANYAFPVDTIHLMKSQLTREGAIYHRISSAPLEKPLSTSGI